MNKKILLGVCIILLVIALGIHERTSSRDNEVHIGVIASLTGTGAYFGEQFVKGVEIAAKQIEQEHGIHITLHTEDSGTDPIKAVSAAKKLIEINKVKVILGDSWTSTTAAIAPIVNENKVILISPSATLDSLSVDDYVFRLIPATKTMMEVLSKYAVTEMKVINLGIVRVDAAFSQEHADDFKTLFTALGGKVLGEEIINLTATDVRPNLTKIKALHPDVVFNLHASGASQGLLMRQAHQINFHPHFIAPWTIENGAVLKDYATDIEGVIYPFPYDKHSTTSQSFQKLVIEQGGTPDLVMANGYDGLTLAFAALKASHNPKEYLQNVKHDGVSGSFNFDQYGDSIREIQIKTVHNGSFVEIQ